MDGGDHPTAALILVGDRDHNLKGTRLRVGGGCERENTPMDAGGGECINREIETLALAKQRKHPPLRASRVQRVAPARLYQRRRAAPCPQVGSAPHASALLPSRGVCSQLLSPTRRHRQRLWRVQLRLAGVVYRFGNALLLPQCGHARVVELRLGSACLRLDQLRLGGGHTSLAFFLRAARLVNNPIVGRADPRKHGPSDDGRSRL
jgi:hypothetical protein